VTETKLLYARQAENVRVVRRRLTAVFEPSTLELPEQTTGSFVL